MGNRAFALIIGLLFLGGASSAGAEVDLSDVPPQLAPWAAWVLHDVPDIVCPDVGGNRRCDWPGELVVEARPGGATVAMAVVADRETTFALPGDRDHWPQEVRVDGAPALVGGEGATPWVRVPAGTHRVTASFVWPQMPQMLVVPGNVGRVTLRLESGEVADPRVDGEGRLWLREGGGDSGGAVETDSARASIYRKISDGVPLTVTTRIRLNVSGRARELVLGDVLLEGSRPVAVNAAMPVQVGADGVARVFARPGSHDIAIEAVVLSAVEQLVAPTPGPDFYDPQEVWVWAPAEDIRSVELGGLTAVDPARTSLPDDWRGMTTFLAEPGAALSLRQTRRGIQEAAPNAVHLDREIWLDVDRGGYTVRDFITGTLNRDWRLNYNNAGGAELGRVAQSGVALSGEDLLITVDPSSNLPGVELRDSTLDLTAELRLDRASPELAIVGWDHDVQSLGATLHLPPGWVLLGGRGVDTMRGTWMASWTLWDFFFVIIVAFVIGRLFGWRWTFVAALALVLSHGETDAPRWVWIHLLVSLAVLRALPAGLPRTVLVAYRAGALAFLVVVLAPFAHQQILHALHPQVAHGSTGGFDMGLMAANQAAPAAPRGGAEADARVMALEEAVSLDSFAAAKAEPSIGISSVGYRRKDALQQIDPNAVVQTGPGLPDWTWSSWSLEWSGPVRRDHTISLWLLTPVMNTVLGFLRVLMLVVLALLLVAPRDMYWRTQPSRGPRWWMRVFGPGVALIVSAAGFAALPQSAHAQTPDPAMLDQLRNRLVAQTTCPQPCVVASDAVIEVDDLAFSMTANVSALGDTGWALPGPGDALRITSVAVDGVETHALRREPDGLVRVRLAEGVHRVTVTGRLAGRNVVTLQFEEATRPRQLQFAARAWSIDGISPTGVPDNSVQLTRTAEREVATDAAPAAVTELPPWFQVSRRVAFGLPWRVYTDVTRQDTSRPQLVKIPLVQGAKVISEGVRVEEGFALVDFGRGEATKSIVSELGITPEVKLVAATGQPWTETWRVECSRIWRCSFSELPPVANTDGTTWMPRWQPWPGESLTVAVQRPKGAAGQPKTIDNVSYVVTPGKRLAEAELTMNVRASQGDWQEITLPESAELQSVVINGSERSIRPEAGKVRLPVRPGSNHFTLRWQQPWTREVVERIPALDIGGEAANVHLELRPGDERWLLALRNDGVVWGPAVVFWPHLAILLLLALILGTFRHLPLGWPEWLLLTFGLSQLPVVVMLPVVAWFLLLDWRGREPQADWSRFDIIQVAIVWLTLAAVAVLYGAVHTNLLLDVDMQVAGMGSGNDALRWYVERNSGALPTPGIVSVPLFVYRVVMFVWALWLVWKLIAWSQWGWTQFSAGGRWRARVAPVQQTAATDGDVGAPVEPVPVERNARDGELVKKEFALGGEDEPEPSPTEEPDGEPEQE